MVDIDHNHFEEESCPSCGTLLSSGSCECDHLEEIRMRDSAINLLKAEANVECNFCGNKHPDKQCPWNQVCSKEAKRRIRLIVKNQLKHFEPNSFEDDLLDLIAPLEKKIEYLIDKLKRKDNS